MRRRGPRPLPLLLSRALTQSKLSAPAWTNWSDASSASAEMLATVARQAARADPELISGIAAYRRHPWRREMPEAPVLWQEGNTRLLDYARKDRPPTGRTVVFVPSLVNRAYILDLAPGRSMLRWLGEQGVRPVLLDWGFPDPAACGFTLTDYVAGRLHRALAAIGPEPVLLAGYCMGGLLALAAAQLAPERVAGLALLATPWDFHADGEHAARALAGMLPALEPVMQFFGALPTDALQSLFMLADVEGVAARFRDFASLDQHSSRAQLFVALEDWLADGVPLAAAVARECLGGWYGHNTPPRGLWRVAGLSIDPAALRLPVFVALPARDRIVPPASARPLAALIPGAVAHLPQAGHIGMAAGSGAEAALWRPLCEWLRSVGG